MTKREDFNEMRDTLMQEAGYWLNDYIDEETMHDDNETMLDAAGRLIASFMTAMRVQEKLDDPLPHHPEPSTKQDAPEAALALHADEFAQKVVDAVKAHLEKQGAKKARDCTDQRGHRFTVEFCERCGVKP